MLYKYYKLQYFNVIEKKKLLGLKLTTERIFAKIGARGAQFFFEYPQTDTIQYNVDITVASTVRTHYEYGTVQRPPLDWRLRQ